VSGPRSCCAGANLKETVRTEAFEMVYFLRKLVD